MRRGSYIGASSYILTRSIRLAVSSFSTFRGTMPAEDSARHKFRRLGDDLIRVQQNGRECPDLLVPQGYERCDRNVITAENNVSYLNMDGCHESFSPKSERIIL